MRQAMQEKQGNSNAQQGQHQPGMIQWWLGIGPEDVSSGRPKSVLIYPLSRFSITWTILTGFMLGYTAIAVPPMIAFHWVDPDCTVLPTLYFDAACDCFFLVDIMVTFGTGIFINGRYTDKFAKVATSYARDMLLFDIVTSFPVSFLELAAKAACESSESTGVVNAGQLRLIRAVKPIRFVKIARIMKVGRVAQVIAMLMDYMNISPKQGKTMKLMITLVMTIHFAACVWWLWKVIGMHLNEIEDFLDKQSWGHWERNSLQTLRGKLEAYIISVYLTTMTLTTVGYGDISADNTSERVGYVVFFIVGAYVWGNLLAGLSEIHKAAGRRDDEQMGSVQDTIELLEAHNCPRGLRSRIVSWIRFIENHDDASLQKKKILRKLTPSLQRELMCHLYSHQVAKPSTLP